MILLNRVFHYVLGIPDCSIRVLTVLLESNDLFDTAEKLLPIFKIGDALTPQ